MAKTSRSFTTNRVSRKRATSTARAYNLDQRQTRIERKASRDLRDSAEELSKKLKQFLKMKKSGTLPMTRQELENEYWELENQIESLTGEAQMMRIIGGQAERVVELEKNIALLSEFQTEIQDITNANIPFLQDTGDVVRFAKQRLKQKALIDPYRRFTNRAREVVASNTAAGFVARSFLQRSINKGGKSLLGKVLGLSGMSSSQRIADLARLRKSSRSIMGTIGDISKNKEYKNADSVTAFRLERGKQREDRRHNQQMERLTETQLKQAAENDEKLGKAFNNFFKMFGKGGRGRVGGGSGGGEGGGIIGSVLGGATALAGEEYLRHKAGGSLAKTGKGFIKGASKAALIAGGVISVADLAMGGKKDAYGNREDFFGDGTVMGTVDSRATSYLSAAALGGAVGGPIGAGIGIAATFLADYWTDMRDFFADTQETNTKEIRDAIEKMPEAYKKAIMESEGYKKLETKERNGGKGVRSFTDPVMDTMRKLTGSPQKDANFYNDGRGNVTYYGEDGAYLGTVTSANAGSLMTAGSASSGNSLMDAIASNEGGFHPNLNYGYDTVIGDDIHSGKRGKYFEANDKPVTQMTMDELLAYQKKLVNRTTPDFGKGRGSSAVGRYQYVGTTLGERVREYRTDPEKRALMQSYGINFDETATFSPENQEALARYEVEEVAGGRAFREGKISQKEFTNNLSGTWASMQNYDGKGTYSWQGAPTNAQGPIENYYANGMNRYSNSPSSEDVARAEQGFFSPYTSKDFGVTPNSRTLLSDQTFEEPGNVYNIPVPVTPEKAFSYNPILPPTPLPGINDMPSVSPSISKTKKNDTTQRKTTATGGNIYGMPLLPEIPTFDTELGALTQMPNYGG